MNEIVELCPAFVWTCPICGLDHFVRAAVVENPDLIDELREEAGFEAWTEGDFMYAPELVTCPHCETEFKTHDMRADEEES